MGTAVVGAAVAVSVFLALPPRAARLATAWDDGSVRGAFHVHTQRSDGRGTPDEVARAAAEAGLEFLIFTDHGDATRAPDPPVYRSGVLCFDAVEISTSGGHYIAVGLGASPYPLGGDPRDVVEDVTRMGGFGIAAHPDSPSDRLTWRQWNTPIDGLEVLNPDTSWRVHLLRGDWRERFRLLRGLATYVIRPSETIGTLLTDGRDVRSAWDEATTERRVVAVAGLDAHAKLALRDTDPGDNRYSLPLPGYLSVFRALSTHVVPASPLTGDAATDARRLLDGLKAGHVYTAVDAWATGAAFEFSATDGVSTAYAGDALTAPEALSLRVRTNAPRGFSTELWRNGRLVGAPFTENDFTVDVGPEPAVYRVEVRSPDHPSGPPWVTSNPIYVRAEVGRALDPPEARFSTTGTVNLFDGRSLSGWETEHDADSLAALDVVPQLSGFALQLRYGLAGGSVAGQYAGAAVPTTGGVAAFDRIALSLRAERPMRLSIQVRALVDGVPQRWQRSIFVDDTERVTTIPFEDMTPVTSTQSPHPPLDAIRNVILVADTTHSKPGTSGRIWISSLRIER